MRLGYSILVGELLEAEEVEIGDCARFQVVCPACREAVFKKTRSRTDGGVTHFLSHHKATDEESRECELRVEAIGRAREEAFNAEARGQTIQRFMAMLRTQIDRAHQKAFPGKNAQREIQSMLAREGFADLLPHARKTLNMTLAWPDPRGMIAMTIGEQREFSGQSPFWQRRQAAHVLDVLQTLAQKQQEPNFRYLFAAVYLNMAWRIDAYRALAAKDEVEGYDPLPAIRVLAALASGKSRAGMVKATAAIIAGGGKSPTNDIAETRMQNLVRGLILEAMGPMIGILASIPFADIAAGRSARPDAVDHRALYDLMRDLLAMTGSPSEEGPATS